MEEHPKKDLKAILKNITFRDDAKVMEQLVDQSLRVKTRMGRIRRKIAVMSGKGGVGKSMTTVNIALALARKGQRVGVLDVDLNGPCIPRMLGVSGRFVSIAEGAVPPLGPYDMKVASMDFFLQQADTPVRWSGPTELSPIWLGLMEMNVIREFLADIVWGELDYLVIDLPPGAAADKPPVIINFIPELDGAIIVTTPSEVAQMVVKKSVAYARDVSIRPLGLIENMSGGRCPKCNTHVAFFDGACDDLASDVGLPILGKIPFSLEVSRSCDQGKPLPADHSVSKAFDNIVKNMEDVLNFRKIMAEAL